MGPLLSELHCTYTSLGGQSNGVIRVLPAPSEEEMDSLYTELNSGKFRPVGLSLVAPFTKSFVLKTLTIPTVPDLSDPHYQDLEHPKLLESLFSKTKYF